MMIRYRGILVVLQAIGLVWIANLLQLFSAPDGWIYDQTVRLGGWQNSRVPSVLMVEIERFDEFTVADGLQVLNHLRGLGADQVIFLSPPRAADSRFYRQASEHGRVIFGRPADDSPYPGGIRDKTKKTTGELPGPASNSALFTIPPAEFGIHRRAATLVKVGEREIPTLAMLASLQRGVEPDPGEFRVNFNQGADWLPRVTVERLLKDGLIPELVEGRSVLIGQALSGIEPGLYTPINSSGRGISLLEFQAHAIDTLLQDSRIRTTPWALNLAMLGSIGLLSLIVYQWFNLDRSSWFTLLLIGIYLALGWLLLHGLLVWIPVVEIAVAQILMFWLFVRLKLLRDDQEMRRTVLERMAKLKEYMLPPDFYNLDEHWAQVITFVDQTLNLNRIIFLEKVEGDHRVREVQALRCSLEDIDERRRDFERVPYSDAIAEGGPVKLEKRLFFSNASDNSCQQYMVPLLFGGEVQGFWAFDVDPIAVETSENFLGNIRNFGNQIAELLYHRHRWIEQRNSDMKAFGRFFRLEAAKASSQEVAELLELLDNRLTALQAVFDGLTTAAIQYDLFGRVIQLNNSMQEFMHQQNLPGYQLTALDLLVAISGMPQDRARRLLQQVVVDRRDFQIPVALDGMEEQNHSVHIRPLAAPETENRAISSTAPFELAGILFELSDESGSQKRFEIKEQLLEWTRLRIRNDLTSLLDDEGIQELPLVASGAGQQPVVLNKVAAIGSSGAYPEQAHQLSPESGSTAPFYSRVCGVLATLDRVQSALSSDWNNPSSSVYPVDAYPLLTSVIDGLSKAATAKGIRFKTEMPRLLGLISVQPDQLTRLFHAILETLISDAAAKSELSIRLIESEDALHFTFSNTGFGIPDEHLQAYVWQPEYGVTEELRDLREAVQPVAGWGGNIEIHSEVGSGIWAELQLGVVN